MLPFFLQNIMYKTLFAINFVGNNYPRRNYLPIKILRKHSRKKSFLANFFNKFAKKIPRMRIFNSVCNNDEINAHINYSLTNTIKT